MITDPLFYAVAIPAVMLVGLSKGGFLGGLGVIGVPTLALVISPVQAAGILLPILMCMDAFAVAGYWRKWDLLNLRMLLPGAAIGIAIGYLTAAYVEEGQVRLLVGLVAVAFTLDHWLGRRDRPPTGPSLAKGTGAGIIAGFTSFVSHAGSPPYQMYMLPQRLDKVVYAGTTVLYFAIINIAKVGPYLALGQFSWPNLTTSLVLMPLAPLSAMLGIWLVRRVPQGPFYRIAYTVLFIIACKLIWDGVSSFL